MQNFKIIFLILISIFVSNVYADKIISNEYYIPYAGQKIHLKEKKLSSSKSGKVIVMVLIR